MLKHKWDTNWRGGGIKQIFKNLPPCLAHQLISCTPLEIHITLIVLPASTSILSHDTLHKSDYYLWVAKQECFEERYWRNRHGTSDSWPGSTVQLNRKRTYFCLRKWFKYNRKGAFQNLDKTTIQHRFTDWKQVSNNALSMHKSVLIYEINSC